MGKRRADKKRKRRERRPIHDVLNQRGPGLPMQPVGAGAAQDEDDASGLLGVSGSSRAVGAFRAFQPVDRVNAAGAGALRGQDGRSTRKRRRRKPRGLLQRIIHRRRWVQAAVGVGVYVLVARYQLNLWWVVLFGSALGIVLGKVFCRWMCPMGFIMETLMGSGDHARSNLYMYFKLGCPIAWISGLLNKVSLFRVTLRPDKCSHCGACEEACYISAFNETHGLHRAEVINASTHYSCSRCLACVAACPTGALSLGTALPTAGRQRRGGAD